MKTALRNTIYSLQAPVEQVQRWEGNQCVMTLSAPQIASAAQPGMFLHVGLSEGHHELRRPLSILWSDREAGTVEVLFKVVGVGTEALAEVKVGMRLPVLGPIGRGFEVDPTHDCPLLIGGGVGIPPILFLTREIRQSVTPFVVMGSEVPFPFKTRPSAILIPGMPDAVIAGMELLEDWGVPSRLCSTQSYAGCYDGYVDALAREWLQARSKKQQARTAIYACGPLPMLQAVSRLAEEFDRPCQVAMEEYMACAVGGCAGCTIPVRTEGGIAMKRVCVDGPVFESRDVFFRQ